MSVMSNKKKFKRLIDKTGGLINFSDLKRPEIKVLYICIYLFLLLCVITCVLPFVWVLLSGFKSVEEMYAVNPTFIPKEFHFENLNIVLSKINVSRYFLNSLCLILGCVVCDILFNGMAGYVLSRLKPTGSKIIEKLIFATMLIPGISMVPLFMTLVDLPILHLNLTGSYASIWIMSAAVPFNVLLFRNFFNGIPMDYIEAARLDGCGDMSIFTKIILPLSKPIITVVAIYTTIGTWGNFMWPYLMLGGTNKEPISVMIYNLATSSELMQNEYMLLVMITMIPMIVIFAIFSKHIMGGLNMSGIKG